MGDIEDDEAERAFQAALLAQGLLPGDDAQNGDEEDEAERAWAAAQEAAMKSAGDQGATMEDEAERAWEALKQEAPKSEPLPAHWEGFISHIEGVWDIIFSDLKFGEQIGVGTLLLC